MIDLVEFGASDHEASTAFCLAALQPRGVAIASEVPPSYVVEICPKGTASLAEF